MQARKENEPEFPPEHVADHPGIQEYPDPMIQNSDAQDIYPDQQGTYPDLQGQNSDPQDTYPDLQGTYTDLQGQYPEL